MLPSFLSLLPCFLLGGQGNFGQQQVEQRVQKIKALQANDIKFVVEQLNRPPFMCHLTSYEFDDKPPLELLETLNKVLVNLDESNKVDISVET